MLSRSSGAFLSMNDEVCERTCQPFDDHKLRNQFGCHVIDETLALGFSQIPERPARRGIGLLDGTRAR